MFLVTGAAGKTGRAVLEGLVKKRQAVRGLVHRKEQAGELQKAGAVDIVTGDMLDAESYQRAMSDVKAVYHICPNMHRLEIDIGRLALEAAQECGLDHFVYHSVLHPQTEKMPHHWQKMRVEELIFESGLDFTILQPAPYMQNILAGRDKILGEGIYRVPYPAETRLSLVDLKDVGEAAAAVLAAPGHRNAVYEIAGTEALSQAEIADLIGTELGCKITVEAVSLEQWRAEAEKTGLAEYAVENLQKMFLYYARYGLKGNNTTLGHLLGREPAGLTDFIYREFIQSSSGV